MQNTVNFSRNSEYSIVPNSGISVIPYQQNQVKNAPNGKVYSNRFIDDHVGGDRINLTPSELEDLRKKALGGKKTHANVYTQTYTSYVNIDSAQRVRFPENNYEQKLYNLPPYPLLFTNGSSIVTVNLPEHPFIKNDRIILDGIISKNLFLENVIMVKKNSLFVRILHSHHGLSLFGLYDETNPSEFEPVEYVDLLPASYNQFDNIPDTGTQYYILKKNVTIDLTIKISGVKGTTIGNIPVNYLNRKQTVYLLFTKVLTSISGQIPSAKSV